MRGIHLSDLHLGKRLKEFSLLEEQEDVLKQVVAYCEQRKGSAAEIDFVIIAGDIFDKGVPPVEALNLFNNFLSSLEKLGVEVFALGGNHDNGERLGFLSEFLKIHHINLVTQYGGRLEAIPLVKGQERVNFYMLPFIKPLDVRRFLPEAERAAIVSYHDAVKYAVSKAELNLEEVNILIAHQFITGAERCDSEEVAVGGLDNVSAEALEAFDYVALGHIHGPQYIKNHPKMRYCGTPLKYSFSECHQEKSMTLIDIADGQVKLSTEPFKPLHDLYELRGTFADFMSSAFVNKYGEHYVHITLTDEDEIVNVLNDMRKCYQRLCYLTYDNSRTKTYEVGSVDVEQSPLELISSFFGKRSGHELSQEQKSFIATLLEDMQEDK